MDAGDEREEKRREDDDGWSSKEKERGDTWSIRFQGLALCYSYHYDGIFSSDCVLHVTIFTQPACLHSLSILMRSSYFPCVLQSSLTMSLRPDGMPAIQFNHTIAWS